MIAGVAWPLYKVVALALGFAVFVLVGVVTMAAAPAVLAGAAAGALVWVTLGFAQSPRTAPTGNGTHHPSRVLTRRRAGADLQLDLERH